MKNNNGKIEHRLTSAEIKQENLCKDVDILKKDVKHILENELPHLKTGMETLSNDIKSLNRLVKIVGTGIFLVITVSIIINLMGK
jgi:hypothetical protein